MMKIYRVCKVRLENKHFIIYLIIPCVSEYMEGNNKFTEMGDISKWRKTITYVIGIANMNTWNFKHYIYIYKYNQSWKYCNNIFVMKNDHKDLKR
jgi:hypothetical protein